MSPAVDLDTVRGWALALPETEEATHFGLPTFNVRDKPFARPHKDATHVVVSVAQDEAALAVAEDPETFEELWRNGGPTGRTFVGLRVDLGRVAPDRMRALVEHAWRHKAPKSRRRRV